MKKTYEKPAIVHTEKLEARATTCAKASDGKRNSSRSKTRGIGASRRKKAANYSGYLATSTGRRFSSDWIRSAIERASSSD